MFNVSIISYSTCEVMLLITQTDSSSSSSPLVVVDQL